MSAEIAYQALLNHLKVATPTIASAIIQELKDQRSCLKLIASENYSSLTVQLTMGTLMTDKYAEGHPHHRFYAGCENVDTIESEAVRLAKELFGAEHAYVQPHSGADANLVAFWAILTQRVQNKEVERLGKKNLDALTPEEFEKVRQLLNNQKVLGLSLDAGGHLTHGFRHNVSAKMMKASTYGVDPNTHHLDYKAIRVKAIEEKPLILLAGYSAYPGRINFAKMREIADEVGAVLMVDMAHFAGLVAGKVFEGEENPVPYADILTSTTHKTLRGPRGGLILCREEFRESIDKGCPLILGGPLPHVMAAKAVGFAEALHPEFKTYAHQVVENARALAATLKSGGYTLVGGGTDNHLVLVDLSNQGITGRQAELALREVGVTVNRNMVPMDKKGAWYTSGIRLGTPALTTLGMGVKEMEEIAHILLDTLKGIEPKTNPKTGGPSLAHYTLKADGIRERVRALKERFPLYPGIEI